MKYFLRFGYALIRCLIYPWLWLARAFSSKINKRWLFETQKLSLEYESYKQINVKADFCFEVASEGELEQVFYLIQYFLMQQKRVELIYCSESVEAAAQNLFKKYPDQIRLYRFSLVSYFPLTGRSVAQWMTSEKLILCRYDFFPQLILAGMFCRNGFFLLSANVEAKNPSWFLRKIYHLFDFIVCANEVSTHLLNTNFEIASSKLMGLDLRVLQIIQRQSFAEDHIKSSLAYGEKLVQYIESVPKNKRIILGNFWPNETAFFEYPYIQSLLRQGYLFMVVPHKLDSQSMQQLIDNLGTLHEFDFFTSSHKANNLSFQTGGVCIVDEKGILCELYAYFACAYVGRGMDYSVHSLLEPYLAGNTILCGPRVERSSEYTWVSARDADALFLCDDFEQVDQSISSALEYQVSYRADFTSLQKRFSILVDKLLP